MSILGKAAYHLNRFRKYGIRSEYFRIAADSKVWNFEPIQLSENDNISIHTVAGHEQLTMYAAMLRSWLIHQGHPRTIYLHDDGSLTDLDYENLNKSFPGIGIISRKMSDDLVGTKINGMPRLKAYRDRMSHALKCIDTFIFAPNERLIILDPDIIFFSKGATIDHWVQDQDSQETWFNQDPLEPSNFTPESCKRALGFPIWEHVNSGLCLTHRTLLDLEFMESCFDNKLFEGTKDWRKEQTLLALLASRNSRGGLLPNEYSVTLEKNRSASACCRHYVGAVRHHFWREGYPHLLRSTQ